MLEMYDGKVTIDISKIDETTRDYLVDFKTTYDEYVNKITSEKAANNKKSTFRSNRDYHKNMISK